MAQKYEQFINRVKEAIHNQPISPNYNPDEWEGISFNCYAYALRACMHFDFFGYCIAPGFISKGKKNDYRATKEHTLQYFKEDCEVLGLQVIPTELKEKTGANEYKIAVYLEEGYDYHFVRQDSNGHWSEKDGWNKPIGLVEEEEIERDHDSYKFLGIFKVSKAG